MIASRLRPQFWALVVALFLALGAPNSLRAQFNSAALNGTVFDQNGAALPSARVTVVNNSTALERQAVSDNNGAFAFPVLPPGSYTIRAQHDGFAVFESRKVTLNVADVLALRIEMKLGSLKESVVVSGQEESLHTDSEMRVNGFSTEEVQTLPNQSRDITSMIRLGPGVQTMFNPRGGNLVTLSIAQAGQISVNGGRSKATATQLDYTDANDWEFGGIALATQPTPDMLSEVKVLANNWSAEYGTKSNGEIVMVTRSGSNNLHGAAYDYLQNSALNARDYYDTTGKPTVLRQNQFGFALGGPVLRNRTFFFGSYEQRETRGSSSAFLATVPSPAARASVTDPTIRQILNLLPLPTTLDSSGLTGKLSVQAPSPSNSKQFIVRVDHTFNERHMLTARYYQNLGSSYSRTSNSLPAFDATFDPQGRNAMLADTYVLNANMVNDARIAYGRASALFTPQDPVTPRFSVTGLVGFGTVQSWPQGRLFNVYQANDVLSIVHRKHNIKAGFDLRYIQDNSVNDSSKHGVYAFTSVSNFLSGTLSSYSQMFGNSYRGYRMQYHGFFVQDDIKLTPTFTANLGVRYEVQGGMSEAHELQSVLDLTSTSTSIGNAGTGILGAFRRKSPVVNGNLNMFGPRLGFAWSPVGTGMVVRGGYGIYFDSFLFNGLQAGRTTPPSNYTVSLAGSAITGGNSLAQLYAGIATIQQQTAAQIGSFGSLKNLGSIVSTSPNLRNPYVYQYSLGVQQQVGHAFLLDLSYVGTKGTALTTYGPANSVISGPTPATSTADEKARYSALKAAYSKEYGAGNTRLDPRFDDVSLLRNNGMSSYNSLQASLETHSYHGLTVRAAYTWSKSMDNASDYSPGQATTDRSFAQSQFNFDAERALSAYDIPHRFTLSNVWQLPFFSGRRDWRGQVLGGWTFSTINQWQVGIPYTVMSGSRLGITDTNLDGNVSSLDNARAVLNPAGVGYKFGKASTIPTPARRGVETDPNGAIQSNTANFKYTQPLLGNNGTARRNSERMNNLLNFDWSFGKRFLLAEQGPMNSGPLALEFRSDLFNIFNTPFLTASGSDFRDLSSPNFGLYNAAGASRKAQLSLRMVW